MGTDILWYYLAGINILTFCLFAADKRRAKEGRWRIRNAALLGLSAAGGALGGWIAMYTFRHKTRTAVYVAGIPLLLTLQTGLLAAFLCARL